MDDRKELQTRLVPGVGRLPYPAYRGNDPYVFVSYAHADSERVFAEIERFNEAGFHVWYDEGIAPGNEWSDEIAEALSKCSVFVVMLTRTSALRENVLNEIGYALDAGKPFLAIYLEETDLTPGMKLRTARKQAILRYNMSAEEYEYKYTEAFLRFGLVRGETQTPKPVAARPYGDYIPKGTAVITNGLGKEFTAIGNSLVYKPAGDILFRTLHDLVSMDKSPNGYVLKDSLGKETLLKTSPGDELWFLPAEDKPRANLLDPEKLQINMIRSIRADLSRTPDRKIRYCDIRMKNGSFKTPAEFLFFSISETDGVPPVMKLKKDLNRFSGKGYASLLMMKKLKFVDAGEADSPYGERGALNVEVQYPGSDSEAFAIDAPFAVYAMGANGEVCQLKQEELQEIEIL